MIHRIRVQNFKSILDVTVDLSPVTVLVGRSGTGKSNFVHAIRFLRDLLLISPAQIHNMLQSPSRTAPATSPNSWPVFEVTFSIPGIDGNFSYQVAFGTTQTGIGPIHEKLDLGAKCLFHQAAVPRQNKMGWSVAPDLAQIPGPGPLALNRIPAISEIVIALTALTSGIGCYAFSDDVLSKSGGKITVQAGTYAPGLDDTAVNYLGTLKEIVTDLQDLSVRRGILGTLQQVNPTVASVELNDLMEPTHAIVAHRLNGKTISLSLAQESGGFRRFYAHLLALYQRPSRQTLIFEHPEDGIHPGALSMLAEEFKDAPKKGRGQVILTTHSPKLLDQFDADEIRVVELEGAATKIGHIAEEQREAIEENLLHPGELLTVDPARMQREGAAP